eukprot:14031329-Alexandrium_andersonii.AAC.1
MDDGELDDEQEARPMSNRDKRRIWLRVQSAAEKLGDSRLAELVQGGLEEVKPPPPATPAPRTAYVQAARAAEIAQKELEAAQARLHSVEQELQDAREALEKAV